MRISSEEEFVWVRISTVEVARIDYVIQLKEANKGMITQSLSIDGDA